MPGLLESIDRSTQLAGYNRLALLLFRLDDRQIFGINVLKVQEVIMRPPMTPMSSAHPYIAGMADIRGVVMPIIDMCKALGQPSDPRAAHVIVAEYNRAVQGFLVRAVDRIIHLGVETVLPPPRTGSGEGYLTAITRYNDELIEIIDVERIYAEVVGMPPTLSGKLGAESHAMAEERRILVADDSRVARAQIERVMQQLGIECVLVNDGREALRYLQGQVEQGGDINDKLLMVISDVEMPDMDGYALTTEIRRDPRLRDLYVLLHTSLSGVFNNAMVKKVGADRFIPKFGADELAQGVLDRLRSISQPA
jgi:two-component system chemotaxis response regulator CheV